MSAELDTAKKLLSTHVSAATATAGDYALVSIAESLETIAALLQKDFDDFIQEDVAPEQGLTMLEKEGLE
jgi:hypothetical protein